MDSENSESTDQQSPWRVVIVGGGFAGVRCVLELAPHDNIQITLLDKNNYQQFHPLLYQVATSILSPSNAAFALRDMLRNFDNVDIQMDEVTSIDLAHSTVHTAAGNSFSGDFLVLATGSHVNFFGIPGADKFTTPLYSLTDAEKLRSAILEAFEAADRNPNDSTPRLLN